MKSILPILLGVVCCYFTHSLRAQVPLPYYSGFDNTAERNGWTIYRLGEAAVGNWSIASVGGFSPNSCISHDYSPSTGVDVVDDWYMSPGFMIPSGGTLDSVRYSFSGFSVPAAGDTIGVYLILGGQDPGTASSIFELKEFRGDEYQADNVYRLLSGISLPATNEMAFIGIRYRNAEASSRWLYVRFDNIAVSAFMTSIDHPETQKDWHIFPNPTTDQVTISHNEKGGEVFLYDQTGILLHQFPLKDGQTNTTLSLRQWPQGIYRLVMQMEDKMETATVLRN